MIGLAGMDGWMDGCMVEDLCSLFSPIGKCWRIGLERWWVVEIIIVRFLNGSMQIGFFCIECHRSRTFFQVMSPLSPHGVS